MKTNIVVTYSPGKEEKKIYQEILGERAKICHLKDESENERIPLINAAEIVIALSFSQKEVHPKEISHLKKARFIQLIFAGADNVPFERIPENIILSGNVGAFAEPIAEHVLALTLALAKNLVTKNELLRKGHFDQSGFNRELRGGICGIVGFGGNGRKIANTMRAMGMKVYGINRSGKTDAPIDFIGTVADMKKVLKASDVVVVTTPLTRETRDLIGVRELQWMKKDAILINVGRGAVINQKALYEHLNSHPDFRVGMDTWWSEPRSHGEFKIEYPFFDLPNIIGSPHIADHVPRSMPNATRKALENVKNFLLGRKIRGVLDRKDYLD